MKKNILIFVIAFSMGLASCSESWMSDVVPTDKQRAEEAFSTIKDGRNALNGVFSLMQSEEYYGANYIAYGDIKAMDVRSYGLGKRKISLYQYTETTEASTSTMWTRPYICLVSINNAIENVVKLKTENAAEEKNKKEIIANFYALRAFVHFDLLKVFSRIPASLSTDISSELGIVHADHVIGRKEKPARKNLKESYEFVISDLKKAIDMMPSSARTEGWLTRSAMKAVLANVYLFLGENKLAYDSALDVINNGGYSLVPYGDYKISWTGDYNNKEAIITLINTEDDNPSREGIGYLWNSKGYNAFAITRSFAKLLEKDDKDERIKAISIKALKDSKGKPILIKEGAYKGEQEKEYRTLKYPNITFNKLYLMRLSEMYFIAAEAIYKVNASNADKAAKLINTVIKVRTNISDKLKASDIDIDRILLEKRKEFVGEGKTFFDLVRNKKDIIRIGTDHLLTAPMSVKYNDYNIIQPIPRIELNVNPNIQQNPTYAK